MGAFSVTGVGPGLSNGVYKPENQNNGCSCGGKCKQPDPVIPTKIGCYTRSSAVQSVVNNKANSKSSNLTVCT